MKCKQCCLIIHVKKSYLYTQAASLMRLVTPQPYILWAQYSICALVDLSRLYLHMALVISSQVCFKIQPLHYADYVTDATIVYVTGTVYA